MKFKALLSFIYHFFLHAASFGIIYILALPIFKWYLGKVPLLGVDFFNSVTYVAYHLRNFTWQFDGFKDIWFSGYPLFRDYPQLQFYLMIPFANYFGLIKGVQYYVLTSALLLFISSYLLYFVISRSKVFALILTLFVIYSVNIYGSAVWGGSLPYFGAQFFVPAILAMIIKYYESLNKRWYYFAILTCAAGFMFHALPIISFAIPGVSLILLFGYKAQNQTFKQGLFARIKQTLIFVFGSLIVALPVSFENLKFLLIDFISSGPWAIIRPFHSASSTSASGGSGGANLPDPTASFYQSLPKLLISDTNTWLFVILGIGFCLFVLVYFLTWKKAVVWRVLPIALFALYVGLHPTLNAYGFNLIAQGWYRAFWLFPIAIGALCAAFWGEFFNFLREKVRVRWFVANLVVSNIPFVILAVPMVLLGYQYFVSEEPEKIIELIDFKSEYSSAHPQALNIRTSDEEREQLKKELVPSFLDANDRNRRIYEADALVNIWWNTLFQMPMVRGYIDPPIAASERGGFFWLDIAIGNDSIVRDFKVSEKIALANALFLIDWYGVYYYEGGRLAISTSAPPSSYLVKNDVFDKNEMIAVKGAIIKWQTASGKPELNRELPQYLNFFKVRDELTSPILYANNAARVLVFSDESGYEDLMRALAAYNINSKYLIPVKAGKKIDDFDFSELSKYDSLILYHYSHGNQDKVFEKLGKYVQNGGKIFIDTGFDGKDAVSKKLPEWFPIKSSDRRGLGRDWKLEVNSDILTKDIDTSKFGPPIFNEDDWKFTYGVDMQSSAKALLTQDGKAILATNDFGQGKVIWSGMNFLYHLTQYKSEEESKLFKNILDQIVKTSETKPILGKAVWIKPEKIEFLSDFGARGVVFKEQFYPGWKAKLLPSGKTLPMYKVGPTMPGFMYVPVDAAGPFELEFTYSGELQPYLTYAFSLISTLFLLDKIIISGFLFGKISRFIFGFTQKSVGKWWEKEDEE